MTIVRSPLRITLGGGGTDLPSYYRHETGFLIAAAIEVCLRAMKSGAVGGKLIGAGGSGFLMFHTDDKSRLRHAMIEAGLTEVCFRFDFEGTKIVVRGAICRR